MRKVVATEWLSIDGVMEAPETWAAPYADEGLEAANAAARDASDAMLLGRTTYEDMAAFWTKQPPGTPMVDHINNVPKYVVSTTLQEPLEWTNSILIRGEEFAERIAELKQQPGKHIGVIGSGTLVRSLLQAGLIDELRLLVHPVVLGSGKRLFVDGLDRTGLKLAKAETFDSGVVALTYEPAGG